MPGLWPKGTSIYRWIPNRGGYSGNRRNNGTDRNYQGRGNAQGQGHRSPAFQGRNITQEQGQYRPAERDYRYRYPDQQRLHDQYV